MGNEKDHPNNFEMEQLEEHGHDSKMEKNESSIRRPWPEFDPQRQNVYQRIMDALLYSYMGPILDKGSKLHKERLAVVDSAVDSKHDEKYAEFPATQEMTNEDLYDVPSFMKAHVLQ